jgi:hypothetical protein
MLRNKILSIILTGTLICAILITTFPSAVAKDEMVEIDQATFELVFNKTHQETINAGEGKLTFSWVIKKYDNDKILFFIDDENIKDEKNKRLPLGNIGGGIIREVSNNESYNGEIEITEGKYTFNWKNNNINVSILLQYNISYPKAPKDESTGCYSSIILSIILFLAMIPAVFGIHKKNRKI